MGGGRKSQVSVKFVFFIVVLLLSLIVVSALNNSINTTQNNTNSSSDNSSLKPDFSISTDKDMYSVGETVNVNVLPPASNYFIKIMGPAA